MKEEQLSIDLRSDTVTKPTKEMKEAMFTAELGDDVFEEDPTVKALEENAADMLGKEAGLFCPSGTMTNQIAIKVHTSPGDEVICDSTAHIYNYEGGGIAFNSGCSIRPIPGDRGRFNAKQVEENIQADNVHFPKTSLVVVENTHNKGGGSIYERSTLQAISDLCREKDIAFHLDGARMFNAVIARDISAKEISEGFDSVSICLSKGLGAPVGSVLVGNNDFIKEARRKRKVMGGGMRQAGILAAAGIFALENNIDRLHEDHERAQELGQEIQDLSIVEEVLPVDTNIVAFKLSNEVSRDDFLSKLASEGIKAVPFGPGMVRMVTHLDITDEMLDRTFEVMKKAEG